MHLINLIGAVALISNAVLAHPHDQENKGNGHDRGQRPNGHHHRTRTHSGEFPSLSMNHTTVHPTGWASTGVVAPHNSTSTWPEISSTCPQNSTHMVTVTARVTRTHYVTRTPRAPVSSGTSFFFSNSTMTPSSTGISNTTLILSNATSFHTSNSSVRADVESTTITRETTLTITEESTVTTVIDGIVSTLTLTKTFERISTIDVGSTATTNSAASTSNGTVTYTPTVNPAATTSSLVTSVTISINPVTEGNGTSLHPSTAMVATTTITATTGSGTPDPKAVHCGLHGLPVGDFLLAGFVEDSANVAVTLLGCYEFCNSVYGYNKGCRSYQFYPEEGTGAPRCDLYGGSVAQSLDSINNYVPNVWYDLECGNPLLI